MTENKLSKVEAHWPKDGEHKNYWTNDWSIDDSTG